MGAMQNRQVCETPKVPRNPQHTWYFNGLDFAEWDRPEIRGIMTIGIGPVGYVAGWGLTDGMDVVFGWDGD
jgi:hypothetical protein